jgi:hypothetical protein
VKPLSAEEVQRDTQELVTPTSGRQALLPLPPHVAERLGHRQTLRPPGEE